MTDEIYVDTVGELRSLFHDSLVQSGVWWSSAKKLDEDIAVAGYNIHMKFFNEYKLPEPKSRFKKTAEEMMLLGFWPEQIRRMQNDLKTDIKISARLQQELLKNKPVIDKKIEEYANLIKAENPRLQFIKTPKTLDQIHFINGALYGYPPESIGFWIKNYHDKNKLREATKHNQILKDKFSIESASSMRLTQEQTNRLVALLEVKKRLLIPTDSLGRVDKTGYLSFMESKYMGD
jgi:hypothetical protein